MADQISERKGGEGVRRLLYLLARWLLRFNYGGAPDDATVTHELGVENQRLYWENSRLKIDNTLLRMKLRAYW